MLQNKRSTNENPNKDECIKKAKELNDFNDRIRPFDKEYIFNEILALSSPHELVCISREYHKLTKKWKLPNIEPDSSILNDGKNIMPVH